MSADPIDEFEAFCSALHDRIAPAAWASEALADAYWRARRAGHSVHALTAATGGIHTATNPVGLLVTRLREMAHRKPLPAGEPSRHLPATHRTCHEHDDCELCMCDPKQRAQHHTPTPMPDWFRDAWRAQRWDDFGRIP